MKMKTINTAVMALFTLVTLNSCTPKMSFTTSTIVPAATGTINVKKDKNSNYMMDVQVMNLADPKNLTPSKNTYLVWMESDDSRVRKLGQLTTSGKALKGELKTSSVAKPDEIFITAEDNADIQNPEGQIILTTKK